jgi:carboxypeptidase C (cathepsin A)
MIGGGFVDPILQINNYDSYLNSVGIVSNEWKKTTGFMQNEAIVKIMSADLSQAAGYINFIVTNDEVINNKYSGVNVQNYKQYDDGNINPSYSIYLQNNKRKFGVPDWVNYIEDNRQMYADFSSDFSLSYRKSLEFILSMNIQTLVYNGQNDFIVNTPGVISYLHALEWEYLKQWK